MHHIITPTLALLLVVPCTHAQVTLEYTDVAQSGVQTNIYQLTGGAPSTPPSDGVDQTWDLTGATWQPIGTMHFRQAAGTPYAITYPDANWAWEQDITGVGMEYLYLQIDNSGMYVLADRVPTSPVVYTNSKKVLQFPMAFGNTFSDDYANNGGPDNVTWSYTGHGTLLTTIGNHPDLAKVWSNEGDVLFWNKSPLHPLVIAMSSNVRAYADAVIGISEVNGGRTVLAYPNPCTDRLTIDGVDAARWRITDLNGRLVLAGSFTFSGVQSLDVSALAAGSYHFLSDASSGLRVVRFSKQ